MIKEDKRTGLYECEECGFHYEDAERARQCQEWCAAHQSCNMDIAHYSIEAKEQRSV